MPVKMLIMTAARNYLLSIRDRNRNYMYARTYHFFFRCQCLSLPVLLRLNIITGNIALVIQNTIGHNYFHFSYTTLVHTSEIVRNNHKCHSGSTDGCMHSCRTMTMMNVTKQ